MATTKKDIIKKFQEEMAYLEINLRRKLEMLENEGLLEHLDAPNEITQEDIMITLNISSEHNEAFHEIFQDTFAGPCLGEPEFKVRRNQLTFNINF